MVGEGWAATCDRQTPPVAGLGLPRAVLFLGKALASPDAERVSRREQVATAGAAVRAAMDGLPPARMFWNDMRVGPSARGDDGLWIALEWIVRAQHQDDDPPGQHFYLLCAHTILEAWWDGETAEESDE